MKRETAEKLARQITAETQYFAYPVQTTVEGKDGQRIPVWNIQVVHGGALAFTITLEGLKLLELFEKAGIDTHTVLNDDANIGL